MLHAKKLASSLLSAIIVLSLAGCGGSAQSSASTASGAPAANASSDAGSSAAASGDKAVTFKFAHTTPSSNVLNNDIQRFCDEVTEASGGRLIVQNYPDSLLGDDDEICDQIYNGAYMMDYVDPAKMEDYYSDYSILVTPYFFESPEEILAFAQSEQGRKMSAAGAAAGIKCLDNMGCYYGARQIMSNKPISTPDDVKGINFRVPPTTMWVAMSNAWGANATTVAFSEAYTALTQGVIDAIENPVPSMYASSFHEACDYLNLTDHMFAANGIIMNNKIFESLDADLQELLVEKAMDFAAYSTQTVLADELDKIAQMEAAGVTVNREVDKEAFRKASETIYSTYKGWSDTLVDDCKATLAEIRGN